MALGSDPLTDFLSTVAQQATAQVVDKVVINTRYLAPIVISAPQPTGAPSEGGGGGPGLTQALQPEIQLYLKGKETPSYSFAPYGSPGETQWPWMKFVLLFTAGTIGYLTYRGVTRRG
jgi:hypothetical protein